MAQAKAIIERQQDTANYALSIYHNDGSTGEKLNAKPTGDLSIGTAYSNAGTALIAFANGLKIRRAIITVTLE